MTYLIEDGSAEKKEGAPQAQQDMTRPKQHNLSDILSAWLSKLLYTCLEDHFQDKKFFQLN